VRLWREWERGSREALELLKAYNREDIVHLEMLMRFAYERLRMLTGVPRVEEPWGCGAARQPTGV
jgi:uncharacterized protein YprB with RNaseH-like and TPR domain